MPTERSSLGRERRIAELARRQHGLVTTAQLAALGFNSQAISYRLAAGRLHRIHRGVFAVGHAIVSVRGSQLAAVLACGDAALASHTTAAAVWGVRPDNGTVRHVVTPARRRSRRGIRVHPAVDLEAADYATRDRIPLTSLARTLADLGDVVRPDHVRAAFVRAEQLRLLNMKEIDDVLRRASRRRGPAVLRELLRGYDPRWQATRSPLELRFLDALADRHLPEPEVNQWISDRYQADFLWREERLIVETDGNEAHGTAGAARYDALRDRDLRRRGYVVLRASYRALMDDPVAVVTAIERALSRAAQAAR